MAPRRFRWHRVSAVLQYDPTGTVEIIVGLCFVLVPGVFLALSRSDIPGGTFWYFSQLGLTEPRMGLWTIIIGVAQVWAAGTNWYAARAWIATILAGALTALLVAYVTSGYGYRNVVPLMVGTILAEMFIAWRCWHERPDPLSVRKGELRTDVPLS